MCGRNTRGWDLGCYVTDIRKELDEIAKSLGAKTRFNSEKTCAELYMPTCWWRWRKEKIIACVKVTGEACVPGRARIISPEPLLDATKELFTKTLSPRVSVRLEVCQ